MKEGKNSALKTQMTCLQRILEAHQHVGTILERADDIHLPNWYIGAGCIPTIVWNALTGYDESRYLNDIDLVYYDADDPSHTSEVAAQQHVSGLFHDLPVRIEVINQARVHVWYEEHFGRAISPYRSVESGINTWLSATAIGVKKQHGQFRVYAPYGLNDLFSMTVRPNALLITEKHYQEKSRQWSWQWPDITVLPWEEQRMLPSVTSEKPIVTAQDTDLDGQIMALETMLRQNPLIQQVLEQAASLKMPQWYLGAGSLSQTVWNIQSQNEVAAHIRDLDIVYFDAQDLSYDRENWHVQQAGEAFRHLPVPVDVKNQARVHLWYERHFGYSIPAYESPEAAINRWPTTATCVGVTVRDAHFSVYAPYGLNDLFGMIARPNKCQITEDIYLKKVERWKRCWPHLQVVAR